jgi:hypothetical protein
VPLQCGASFPDRYDLVRVTLGSGPDEGLPAPLEPPGHISLFRVQIQEPNRASNAASAAMLRCCDQACGTQALWDTGTLGHQGTSGDAEPSEPVAPRRSRRTSPAFLRECLSEGSCAAPRPNGGLFYSTGTDGNGVLGEDDTGPNAYGVFGISSSGYAGYFNGKVTISGDLNVTGTKNFRIDDPLDPGDKFLVHAAVESNEVLNVYSGNVSTNGQGLAVVQLPAWFDRINTDFRYQLTIVGTRGWNARVSREIQNNQFTIQTDKANVKVSWQVSARRNDAYLRAHPFQAEQAKTGEERGKYVDPQAYGRPASDSIEKTPPAPPATPPTPEATLPLPPPPGIGG